MTLFEATSQNDRGFFYVDIKQVKENRCFNE
jgi:hypothetical protein